MTQRTRKYRPAHRLKRRASRPTWLGLSAITLIVAGITGFVLTYALAVFFQSQQDFTVGGMTLFHASRNTTYEVVETQRPHYERSPEGPKAALSPLSPVFTPEVQYWGPLIKAWASFYSVNPNLIATVIQIESCGDPMVSSPAGAQGLFQVMPFHFTAGEDMLDVQTNARRGLDYLTGGLARADGHVGLALAGYNGGHGVINRGWAAWAFETQRYYYWGARIYSEAVSGMATSPTLQEWLAAGGYSLCTKASESQQQVEKEQAMQPASRAHGPVKFRQCLTQHRHSAPQARNYWT